MKILFLTSALLIILALVYLDIYIYFPKSDKLLPKISSYIAGIVLIATTIYVFITFGFMASVMYILILLLIFVSIDLTRGIIHKTNFNISFIEILFVYFLLLILTYGFLTVTFIEDETKISSETVTLQTDSGATDNFVVIELDKNGGYCTRSSKTKISNIIHFENIESFKKVKSGEKIIINKYIETKNSVLSYFNFFNPKSTSYEMYTVYIMD